MHKMSVKVTEAVDGLHCWPEATPNRSYLRYSHRHKFTVTVYAEVTHANRHIEFHDLQDRVMESLISLATPKSAAKGLMDFCDSSCETIGIHILKELPYVDKVEVMEDSECGAVVERGSSDE